MAGIAGLEARRDADAVDQVSQLEADIAESTFASCSTASRSKPMRAGCGALSKIGRIKRNITHSVTEASCSPDRIGRIQAESGAVERCKTAHVSKAPLHCDFTYRKQILGSR